MAGSTWRAAWFLFAYLVWGWLLWAAVVTATVTAAALCITLAGIPLLIAAAGVIRGCANAERWRLREVLAAADPWRVPGRAAARHPRPGPHPLVRPGHLARFRLPVRPVPAPVGARLRGRGGLAGAAGRDHACPSGTGTSPETFNNGQSAHGLQFGYFPNGPSGPGSWGWFVGNLHQALIAAGICLVLFLLFNYVLVATARLHARIASALLRAPADPMAEAKDVLTRPGPLGPLHPEPNPADSCTRSQCIRRIDAGPHP